MKRPMGKLFGMEVVLDDALSADEIKIEFPTLAPFKPGVEVTRLGLIRRRVMTLEEFEREFPPKASR